MDFESVCMRFVDIQLMQTAGKREVGVKGAMHSFQLLHACGDPRAPLSLLLHHCTDVIALSAQVISN